jgi:hypothetical protein
MFIDGPPLKTAPSGAFLVRTALASAARFQGLNNETVFLN